jgi:hypothetical protein
MDLGDFVAATLVEIAKGLRRANDTLNSPELRAVGLPDDGQRTTYFSLVPKTSAADRTVAFDVAVTASNKVAGTVEGKTDGLVRVLGADLSANASGEHAHESVSRVAFRVNVEFLIC